MHTSQTYITYINTAVHCLTLHALHAIPTYTYIHSVILHYTTLHRIALHTYMKKHMHHTTLHFITVHYSELHTLHHIGFHTLKKKKEKEKHTLHMHVCMHESNYLALHYITITIPYCTFRFVTLHTYIHTYNTNINGFIIPGISHCITLHYVASHYITLNHIHTFI